jgi:hypothetical protein
MSSFNRSTLWGLCALALVGLRSAAGPISAEQQQCLSKAHRFERSGWIYLHVEGEPKNRGFQHGYLLAPEIAEGLRVTRACWEYATAMPWPWVIERAAQMFTPRIDAENLAELAGIADGMSAAGHPATRDELIAYNGIIELSSYWWPTELKKIKDGPGPAVRDSCSSFIATGSMTRDGNIVLGHNTMMDYNDVFPNIIEDIVPARGHRILWQTEPGWIHSGTDFFITDAGLVGSETTIGDFEGFETNAVPEFVRMRRATQDASSIDEWCRTMRQDNNGGYANAWLVGDINTREIARLELGLKQVGLEKKRDGYFVGSNVAEDPKLLRFETNTKDTDIRTSGVARRVRWKKLMKESTGRIDVALAKQFEADHFDSFLGRKQPGGRSLCGHFELQSEPAGSWPGVPYGCSGTVDGKVVDAAMAKSMSFAARWGSACGRAFDASEYLEAHPQFDWMANILKSRPSEPWTEFKAGE